MAADRHLARAPHGAVAPSPWVTRFAQLVPPTGPVLDVACGAGRHSRFFRDRGHPVTAVDRDLTGFEELDDARFNAVTVDLEDGRPWPLGDAIFAGVVVCNYLYRPILSDIVAAVAQGGVLFYETFARGNERFGRPRNPDHLLLPGELLDVVRGQLRVVAYEDVTTGAPRPSCVQRIVAVRAATAPEVQPIPQP